MGYWLVPINRYVRFVSNSGRTVVPKFSDLREAALSGRLDRFVCEVRGALVDIRAGDTVWGYLPELDVGLIAMGLAQRPKAGKKATVAVKIDRKRTRILAADPLAASTIRRWVPDLRHGSVDLELRPRAFSVIDSWVNERNERDLEALEPFSVKTWRDAAGSTRSLSLALHDIVAPIARLLRAQEFAVGVVTPIAKEPRFIARRMRNVVVLQVCRLSSSKGRAEISAAVGSLLETRWRLERETGDPNFRFTPWLACSSRPDAEMIAFLEDLGILASWPLRGGLVDLTERSKQYWYQHLGVR